MTAQLEQLTTEGRKLTPAELDELRSWSAAYHPEDPSPPNDRDAPVDWSDLPGRVKEIFRDTPPLPENIVLTLRAEERF